MTHQKLAELAAIGSDKAYRAAKYLAQQHFGHDKPMMVHKAQIGADRIEAAEAIRILTDVYCEGAGIVLAIYKLSEVKTRFK